ncbi:50S ribosomal protein L10 [Candidatus Marinamargulisbacteria bacterium SCGC AG-410-N11]|nr:50S ribosomal protein L10 [Candidatus Marinamargulisbacteria bacterium SCGC AG-410-N11]
MVTAKKSISEEKKQIVSNLESLVDNKGAHLFLNYRGLNVQEMTDLRSRLRSADEDVQAGIYKNKLTKIAFDNKEIEYPGSLLKEPSLIVSVGGDICKVSKICVTYSKENKSLLIKGGIHRGAYIGGDVVEQLSKLPSRDELVAKTVMLIKGPINSFVMTVKNPLNKLIYALKAIEETKK